MPFSTPPVKKPVRNPRRGASHHPGEPAAAALGELILRSVVAAGIVKDGRFEYANEALATLFGYTAADLQRRIALADLAIEADQPAVAESLRKCVAGRGETSRLEFSGRRSDGGLVVVEMRARRLRFRGGPAAGIAVLDITEKSHAFNRLRDLAFYDPLTDLPNRALFFDRLRHPISAARRSGERAAVMLADLDGFKAVNDAHGHESGDLVLKSVAQRLLACRRETDTLARLGGDEFAAILPQLDSREQAAAVAERMIRALGEPFRLGSQDVTMGISIGIALCPDNSTDMDQLLALADAAMYESKSRGKNRFSFAAEGQPPAPVRALIEWSNALLLGVDVIDAQHRRLVELANALGGQLREGGDAATLSASLGDLLSHTKLHFRTEEALMDAYDLPGVDQHRQEHRRLLADLESLGASLRTTSMMLALQHLRAWLIRHVGSLDQELAQDLRSRGHV